MIRKRYFNFVVIAMLLIGFCGGVWAQDIVLSHQKISDTQGGFTGTLDDDDLLGCDITSLGDLDGDGITDIAVGAYGDDDGGTRRGAVWILFLNSDGTVKSHQKISDTQGGFTGTLNDNNLFGISVCSIEDLDGDGISDIAVGAVGDDDGGAYRGAVWILFLNTDGTVKGHQKISDMQGGFTGTLGDNDRFGQSVTLVGDLNGDGVNDIAVGAWLDDDGGTDTGAVWILFLDTDGTVKSHQKISDTQGGFGGSLSSWDYFGYSVASIGDLDGDGVTDIAVGAIWDIDGEKTVWILFLNSDGTVKSYQAINETQGGFTGTLDYMDYFSVGIAPLGDMDGDGVNDILVGACKDDDGGADRGAVWVLFLNTDGTVKDHQKISDTQGNFTGTLDDNDGFGRRMANLGDLDGDGMTDIVVSAYSDDDGGTDRGAVWVLFLSDSGTGTETNPYVITTVEQLQEMQDDLGAYYVLGNDIDASDTVNWNGGAGFEPVGYYIDDSNFFPFTGKFDGQGYTITGIYINRPTTDGVGVFGYLRDGAEVKNVGLSDVDITARRNSGSLVGYSSGATVSNSWSSGEIRGSHNYQMRLGGLLGVSSDANSYVYQCFSSVNVTATGGAHQIGGLAGYNGHGSVMSDCYATGNVSGYWKVGGLVGDNTDGSDGTLIERCYSAGKVTGNGGGLVGHNWLGGVTRDSYWDVRTSGKSFSYGGTPKTTAQMMQQATFVSWNFNGVWGIDEGRSYPYFQEPGVLESLEIEGPDEVAEDSETDFKAIAHYDNGGSRDITDLVEWLSWPEAICSIDENGVLSTEILNTPEAQVTVYAAYAEGEVEAEKQVKVLSNCLAGSALEFDGVDDYVELPDTIKTHLGSNYTISAWVKVDTVSANNVIVAYRSIADTYPVLFQLDHLNTDARFVVRDGSRNIATAVFSNALTIGDWYHVVGVREGNTLRVYVNGVSGVSDSDHFTTIIPDNFKIGAFQYGDNPPGHFLDGSIDEVRIYGRALSVEEIQQLYVGGNVDSGLVGRWNFDEGHGQVVHDSSGNGNDGQLGASDEVDDSDPNWVEPGASRVVCSVPQIMRRNIHGAIGLKRDAMEDIHKALRKEFATLRMLFRIVRNKDYGFWKKIHLIKARKHIFGAIIKEFHAKLKLRESIEELKAALKALEGEITPEDRPVRPAAGYNRRGRGR